MSRLEEIDRTLIIANPYQPRTVFDRDAIHDLSQSIRENGLIQPIVVRPVLNGKYEIVAGERRFKAASMAGYQKIPCIVQTYDDHQSATVALIENIQRENLSPIEEAKAYEQLIAMNQYTQAELALKVGKKQSTIANKLRLLKLPEPLQQALKDKTLTERHARAMLSLKNDEQMVDMAKQVIDQHLTVKQTEGLVGQQVKKNKPKVKVLTQNVKIALNTIKQACAMIQKSGIDIHMDETDEEDYYTIILKVKKHK